MLNESMNNPCGILYVDDEEKALKYFRMAFSKKFEIFTASSAKQGLEILEAESSKIGIVLSDQRMPEMLGAEFLGRVRHSHPQMVRILTTAFSDLDSAIQAVNEGHIYQYVVKPWEVNDLAMVLQRAADYHRVLSERDSLLALKMTTLQRVLCSDRLKWLLLLAGRMEDGGAFRAALAAMLVAMPDDLLVSAADGAFNSRQFEIQQLIEGEYRNAEKISGWLEPGATDASLEGGDALNPKLAGALAALIHSLSASGARAATGEGNVVLETGPVEDSAPTLLAKLFGIFVQRETPEASVRLLAALTASGEAGLTLKIAASDAPVTLAFAPLAANVDAEHVIQQLYARFSTSDIAQM